jgi:predicted nucleic acid-binding protein
VTGYILDTKVFNALLDGELELSLFAEKRICVVHPQQDELANTPDPVRREALLAVARKLGAEPIATSSAVWGVSKFDQAKWTKSDGLFDRIRSEIEEVDASAGKQLRPQNQSRDALLGETAIREGLTLVTNDKGLTAVVRAHGGKVVSLVEFSSLN